MSLNLKIFNPLQDNGWDELLRSNPQYGIFHTGAWARVLAESYQYHPVYFAAIENQRLLAAIPIMEVRSFLTGRRGVSLPFSDYCEPIIAEKSCVPEVTAAILQHAKNAGWKSLEWRGETAQPPDAAPSSFYYGHELELSPGPDRLMAGFRNNFRANLRKAAKAEITIELSHQLEAIEGFYRLNCLTRKRHGLPPQPRYFFKKIFEHMIAPKLGFVARAIYREKIIAGAVFFHQGKNALYKYSASDEAFKNLNAGTLLIAEALKWYSQNGYHTFCFGRTEPENQGLRHFKNGWGTTERMINYFKYDLGTNAVVTAVPAVKSWHHQIFRRMPIPLLKMAGALAYKHLG